MSPNFTIKDNDSQIILMVPESWKIPLTIISCVKGYFGIDHYVLEILRDRLESFADGRDDLSDNFQNYMKNIEGLSVENELSSTTTKKEEEIK